MEFVTFISVFFSIIVIMITVDAFTFIRRYMKRDKMTFKEAAIRVYKDFFYIP